MTKTEQNLVKHITALDESDWDSMEFYEAKVALIEFKDALLLKERKKKSKASQEVRRLKEAGAESKRTPTGMLWRLREGAYGQIRGVYEWFTRAQAIRALNWVEKNSQSKGI